MYISLLLMRNNERASREDQNKMEKYFKVL